MLVRYNPHTDSWLCPITSTPQRRGILNISETQYFELVDQSGRILRQNKRGSINPDLAPILSRIGAKPEAWIDTISLFGSKFHVAARRHSNLRNLPIRLGFIGFPDFQRPEPHSYNLPPRANSRTQKAVITIPSTNSCSLFPIYDSCRHFQEILYFRRRTFLPNNN
jgi:hypothetical protein